MRGSRILCLAGCAVSLCATSSVLAGTNNDVDLDAMKARLAELETRDAQRDVAFKNLQSELDRVQTTNNDNWLTEARAGEIRGIVTDVLADADTRASLLQSGMTSGYNGGFVVGSSDGNFRLKMNGLVQFRYVYNMRDANSTPGVDEHVAGFENTRTRLKFSGHVVNPAWTYYIQGEFSRSGGGFGLLDAWAGYNYGNGWSVRAGQFKAPFSRETLLDDSRQLLVERSVVDGMYGAGRVQGIDFAYTADDWRMHAAYTDGAGSANSAWGSAVETEYAFTTRFEYKMEGTWDQFNDFTSAPGSSNGWLLGGAFHIQDGEYGTAAIETEMMAATVDISGEFDGANLFLSGYWVDLDNGFLFDVTRYGVVAQGGFYFTDDVEGFVRYEWADLDGGVGVEDVSVITVGVNKYFSGHQVKWTTDLGYSLEEAQGGALGAMSSRGWLPDVASEDGQIVLRTQLQMTF
jgi:hypothetical protein